MPTYHYKCTDINCGWEGDLVAEVDRRDFQVCPAEHILGPTKAENGEIVPMVKRCGMPLQRVFDPGDVAINIPPHMQAGFEAVDPFRLSGGYKSSRRELEPIGKDD